MTVKTGRFVVRRNGVVVDASASWKVGPAISSSAVTGADASATWRNPALVSVLETDHTDHDYDGQPVEIDWVDEQGTTRVFTGRVQQTSGGSLEEPSSQLTDGTDRLARRLDLRPMAYTLPVHPINAGHGARKRHVGLHGIWITHQAMVEAGFDPGVPRHWSCVSYQSMCGSVATVPDERHAFASLGDLRQAHRLSNPDVAPGFVQDENQIVAEDVFTFLVTSPPQPDTENLPWQLTWDLPIDGGIDGELVLRNLDTAAGLAVKWSTNNMSFYKHNETGTQELLGTVVRDRDLETGDKRWSVIVAPSGTAVIVRTDARGEVARWEGAGTVHPLPTGKNGLCTLRTKVPGKIGVTAVSRGDRHYMTTEPPKGRILRKDLTATSLPGWPSMPDQEAGRILTDQADAHRGLRGQPLWVWIDHNGLLVNADFDTLAARPVKHEFDTRPDSGDLALDSLTWETDVKGAPFSKVEVKGVRMSMALRDLPTLLLAEGVAQGLTNGDEYVEFLNAESGTTWFEPDLRPLMAGWPYPSPPYDPRYKNNLNREEKSWVGGHRFFRDSGERRGWLHPYQMSWTVDAAGHVVNAMRQITPETVIVEGKAVLPTGQWPQDASTAPDPGSQGLRAARKEQPFPQLRGYGLGREVETSIDFPLEGADSQLTPHTHDCGFWIQSNTGQERIGSALVGQITRPTPTRTARVEQTGWVKAGDKVLLRERRRNGYVIEEEVVVSPIEGETDSSDDAMTITGVVTARRVIQTDPDAPPVDEEEEWITPPPVAPPAPPRGTTPPPREDDPGDPGDPPGSGPVKPSTPTLTYDPHGLLVSTWDGQNAAGGSAVTAYFGSAEVALAKVATPEEPIGHMVAQQDGTFLFSEPSVDYDTQWWVRIRVVDRWGRVSPWSDVAGPAEVVPLVDPEQFEELELLLDQTRTEIADSGVILDQKLGQMEADLEQAGLDIDAAEVRLSNAEGEINTASAWIADTGAELGTNLAQAQQDIDAAEGRLDGAETRLTAAEGEIADASSWIDGTGAQLGTRLGTAEGKLNAAFPSGVFDVDAAIDAAVAGAGGNVTTYSNITEANKPGPAPTSTTGRKSGDIHRNRNSSTYEVYAEWMLGANGNWQPVNFGDSILRSLDVGKITGGAGAFETFVTNNLTSNEAVVNDLWTNVVRSRKITTDMLIVGSGENLWPDPFFQDEPRWNSNGVTAGASANDAPGGREMRLTSSSSAQYTYYPDINSRDIKLKPGHKYKLRYAARRGGTLPHESTLRFYCRYEDATGATRGSWENIPHPENHTFTYYEAEVTAPSDMVGGCTVAIWRGANTTSSVLIADVSLVSMVDSSLVVDGGITAKKITITGDENNPDEAGLVANIASIMNLDVENLTATGTSTLKTAVIENLWTNVVRSRKITTDMLIVGAGDNALGNPSFAENGNGWTTHSLASFPDSLGMGGGACLRLAASATQRGSYYGTAPGDRELRPTVTPGETFRFTGWVRCGGKTIPTNGARIFVRWYDATGESWIPPLESIGNEAPIPADTWTKVEGQLTAPEGAASVAMSMHAQAAADGIIYWSNPSIVRAADASLVVDGAITAKKITITGDPDNPDEVGLVANMASILHLTAENLYVPGTATVEEGIINTLWTQVVRSQKITTDMLLVGSGVNLMVDPGFNDAELNAYRNSISIGAWTEIGVSPYGGTNRMRLTNASTGVNTLELREHGNVFMPIDPGETYRIRLRAVRHSTGSATIRPAMRFRRADGTSGYVGAGAYQQIETDLTKISTAWHEWTWKAPADAVSAQVTVQVNGETSFVDVVSPSFTVSGASLIVDGTIAARHIDAESIAAEVGEFVEITANQIKAGTLSAAVTMTGSLTLSSTNGKIRTAASGARAEMDRDGFHVIDPFGRSTFEATSAGVEMVGDFRTGIASNMGVHIFPSTSTYGQGTIEFRHSSLTSTTYPSLYLNTEPSFGTHLALKGPHASDPGIRLSEFQTTINGRSSLVLESGSGGISLVGGYDIKLGGPITIEETGPAGYVTQMWANPRDEHRFYSSQIMRVGAGSSTMNTNPTNELKLETNGASWITGVGTGTTTTNSANTHTASDGRIRRSTSLSKHKLAQEDFTDLEAIKALRPITWIDRADAEAYAEALWSGDEEALKGIGQLRRQVGLIAEEVAEAAPILVNYDNDGTLFGVAYERVASASLLWHQESDQRHDAAEAEIRALRKELDALRS